MERARSVCVCVCGRKRQKENEPRNCEAMSLLMRLRQFMSAKRLWR